MHLGLGRFASHERAPSPGRHRRLLPRLVVGVLVFVALLYIVVLAEPAPDLGGNWRTTTFGSAIDDWRSFVRTLLNGLTFAGLLFIVASGFSLIFGLMRVVNMAHGSFYLLGGYIAYEIQQKMTGARASRSRATDVITWEWVLPALVAVGVSALVGLVVQQVFLRWNQGQELRQALITIAISVIIADQVIAHFNEGLASPSRGPGGRTGSSTAAPRHRLLARRGSWCCCSASSSGSRSGCGSTGRGRAWSSAPASTTAR